MRTVIQRPLKMLNPHTDNTFLWGEKRSVNKGVSSCQVRSRTSRGQHRPPFITLLFNLEHLKRVNQIEARLNQPVSIANFHCRSLVLHFLRGELLLATAFALGQLFHNGFQIVRRE